MTPTYTLKCVWERSGKNTEFTAQMPTSSTRWDFIAEREWEKWWERLTEERDRHAKVNSTALVAYKQTGDQLKDKPE